MRESFAAIFRRMRRASAPMTIGAAVVLAGCDMDRMVRAVDPDIILPEFVQNASGADALRIGTLGRFNAATTGGATDEPMALLGGLLGDEFGAGDTFTQRIETDQRSLTVENAQVSAAYRQIHRVRIGAIQAREALEQFAPTPAWKRAEMYFVEAYVINMLAEHFCNGQPLSSIKAGVESYGEPLPNTALYDKALQLADSGAALVASTGNGTDDVRVRNSLAVLRGRVMINQGNFQGARTATTSVPTTFVWAQEHSLTFRTPTVWAFVNNQRRYIVSNAEGPAQLNFGTANDPRVPTCTVGTAGCTSAALTTRRPSVSGNTAVPDMLYRLV